MENIPTKAQIEDLVMKEEYGSTNYLKPVLKCDLQSG